MTSNELQALTTQEGVIHTSHGLPMRACILDTKQAFGRVDVLVYNPQFPSVQRWVSLGSLGTLKPLAK